MPCAPLSNAISLMQRSPPCLPIDAYNAALQTTKMVIACAGYRIASTPGHHRLHFEAAGIALGSKAKRFLDYFDTCRRKRNVIDYDAAFVSTDTEAEEILKEANAFRKFVEQWINSTHPGLAKT